MPAPACVRARMTPTHALGGVAAASVLLLGSALGAHADERYPSQADVDRSRAAVAGTGLQIAALDARYAQAAAEVASTQERAARLGEAANGAAYELKQATKAAAEARRKAQAAQAEAKDARADLRDYAVAVYEQGGAFDSLGPLLEAGHPQDFVDRAASLEIVGPTRRLVCARPSWSAPPRMPSSARPPRPKPLAPRPRSRRRRPSGWPGTSWHWPDPRPHD